MRLRTIFLMAILTVICSSAVATGKPLKVYILAGQSNMQGSAHKRTFAAIGDDPKTAALLSEILDQNGDPVICDNAWITYLTSRRDGDAALHGKVKVGYGFDGERIGPEYGFGIYREGTRQRPCEGEGRPLLPRDDPVRSDDTEGRREYQEGCSRLRRRAGL